MTDYPASGVCLGGISAAEFSFTDNPISSEEIVREIQVIHRGNCEGN